MAIPTNTASGKKPPSEYIGKFEKQNKSLRETLQTHMIKDLDAFGINTNDYDCFINHRAKAIASALNAKLMSTASALSAEVENEE